jgi:hypothetical protein
LALSFLLRLLFPHKAMDVWSPLSSLLGFELWFFCHFSIWAALLHVGCSFPLF